MNILDVLLLTAVIAACVLAIAAVRCRNKQGRGCCGNCADCGGCKF